MLTILFDGVAYGMLLFVLACGLSVTLGLMNFVNLAHGSFAMAGGVNTPLRVNPAGRPIRWRPGARVSRDGGHRRRAGAHALRPCLRQEPSRPGAVHHRPRLH